MGLLVAAMLLLYIVINKLTLPDIEGTKAEADEVLKFTVEIQTSCSGSSISLLLRRSGSMCEKQFQPICHVG